MPSARAAIFGFLLCISACGGGGGSGMPSTPAQPSNPGTPATLDTSINYTLNNVGSGLLLDIAASSQSAAAAAVQAPANGSQSQMWHLIPATANQYKIINANSGQVLGISAASTQSGAAAVQYADSGSGDHIWEVLNVGSGRYTIKNVNSGLLLGIGSESTSTGADAVQSSDTGTTSQEWTLSSAGAAYANPRAVTGNVAPVHDPSMINATNGYLLFATGGGIELRVSADRINFTTTTAVYAFAEQPGWTAAYTNGTDLWAPDVSFNNGKYFLYFAASTFGSSNSAIGLGTSSTSS
jgi:arabinan endo-1,5-alpha-L-arabinosidase